MSGATHASAWQALHFHGRYLPLIGILRSIEQSLVGPLSQTAALSGLKSSCTSNTPANRIWNVVYITMPSMWCILYESLVGIGGGPPAAICRAGIAIT